jgi:hypothetical protein
MERAMAAGTELEYQYRYAKAAFDALNEAGISWMRRSEWLGYE